MSKWAAEVAGRSRFVAAMALDQASANPGGLPVPCLVIINKADLRSEHRDTLCCICTASGASALGTCTQFGHGAWCQVWARTPGDQG